MSTVDTPKEFSDVPFLKIPRTGISPETRDTVQLNEYAPDQDSDITDGHGL